MTYPETIDYLYSRLPMFHRIGAAAYRADLNNILAMTNRLDHPEKKFKSIHVAGTNGKGSVSNMLASVLQEAGYKTGLFTSPHLKDFRERIRINGEMILKEEVTRCVVEYKDMFEDVEPSFFEWTTALAFKYFADEKVDVAVIEVGLGGRLDSTNVILPELSVITNISFDHMQLLGDTLVKIAGEKAGIIKKNIPVVIGERQEECENVFIDRAKEMNSFIEFASDNYNAEKITTTLFDQIVLVHDLKKFKEENFRLDLPGIYQLKNLCTALQSLEVLQKFFPKINQGNIADGLANIRKNTGLMGRWQVIDNMPLTIVDVGHNEAGIEFITQQLESLHPAKLHVVFGMVNDKNPSLVLSRLPPHAEYYFCKADLPRAMDANELLLSASEFKLKGEAFSSVSQALQAAKKRASADDLIFVGGSTFVVAEVI